MMDLFFGPVAIWFGIPALVGTAFFALRTTLMLVGGAMDADAGGVDTDFDAGGGDSGTGAGDVDDSTAAFKVLSLQAISAFLMGFGWGGLGAYRGSGWPPMAAVLVGLVAGGAMMWLLGSMLRLLFRLQSSGNLPIYQALEAEGSVYAQIPAAGEGRGEVRVVIGDRERYYRAITAGSAIPTGAKVRVVSVNEDDNSVTVAEA
jgi:hypothetical protein